MIHLRCEIAIPSGLRRSRVFTRLEESEPDTLVLLQARGLVDATHQVVDASGHPLITFLSERDPGVATDLMRLGFWELPETIAVLASIRPGARVIDAGAQVGYYSILMARAAKGIGRVYAYEPDPDNFRTLAANASLTAQMTPDVSPIESFPVALTDRTGNVRLHRSDRNPGDHSLVPWPDAIDNRIVPTTTIDAQRWGNGNGTRISQPIDLIKVDVSNGEFDLLKGAERTLAADRPVLVVTVRPAAKDPEAAPTLVGWLQDRGYGAFRLLPPGAADPYQLVCDAARIAGATEAAEFLRRRPPAPQLTLLAYPEPLHPMATVG